MTIQRKIPMRDIIILTLGYHILTKTELLDRLVKEYSKDYFFNDHRVTQFLQKLSRDELIEYKIADNRFLHQLSDKGINEYRLIREKIALTN